MTYAFLEDFYSRRKQVKRYFALVLQAERTHKRGGATQIEIDRLHILRAGTFLILYNLIEASARAGLQGIHDEMVAKRVRFYDLAESIKREVIKGFKRNGDADAHFAMTDIPVEFVGIALDADHHFSGNVDAKRLRDIAKVYGFSATTVSKRTHEGKDLLPIKAIRNDLAHGVKTYDEIGRSFTGRDLLEIGVRSLAYIEEMLLNVASYLKNEEFAIPVSIPDEQPKPPLSGDQ